MGTFSESGPWSRHRLSLRLFFNWGGEKRKERFKNCRHQHRESFQHSMRLKPFLVYKLSHSTNSALRLFVEIGTNVEMIEG